MDTQSSEPTSDGPLDVNTAAEAFNALELPRGNEQQEEPNPVDAEAAKLAAKEAPKDVEAPEPEPDAVTVEIDGKTMQLTKAQIAEAYKSGLRQDDYTRKTMEAAELRKTADAEAAQARMQRDQYAQNLQRMQAQLEGALQEQQRIDWDALIADNPQEALRQQHLFNKRQAAHQQNLAQQQWIAAQIQAEQQSNLQRHMSQQQEQLLATLPDWKDPQKAKAEQDAIKSYLKKTGYDDGVIQNISDYRAVVLARKAMLFDQMVEKASAANKRVTTLPAKVERPGVAEQSQGLDKRSSAMQRLTKTGRVEDAAAVFSSLLS